MTMRPLGSRCLRNRSTCSKLTCSFAPTLVFFTFLILSCDAGTLPSISAVSTAAAAAVQAASQMARAEQSNNDAVDAVATEQGTQELGTSDDNVVISTTTLGVDATTESVSGEGDGGVGANDDEALAGAGNSTSSHITAAITAEPTSHPTKLASDMPSYVPTTDAPVSPAPTDAPTAGPTVTFGSPSEKPTEPTKAPTDSPTAPPITTAEPTQGLTSSPVSDPPIQDPSVSPISDSPTRIPSVSPVLGEDTLAEDDIDGVVYTNVSNAANAEEEDDKDDDEDDDEAVASNSTLYNTTAVAEDTLTEEASTGNITANVSDTLSVGDGDEAVASNSTSDNVTSTGGLPDSDEDIILEEDPYPYLVSRDTSLCAYEVAGVLTCADWRGFCTGDCEFNSYQNGSGCHVTQRMPLTSDDAAEPAGCGCDNAEICTCHHPTHNIKYHIGRECHSHMRVDSGEEVYVFPGVVHVDDEGGESTSNYSGGSGRRKLGTGDESTAAKRRRSSNLRRRV
mmetsp:Transcript_22424/g.64398  ORF Transcript_22424/g.64398 Transcript_22424/m.64398 type:complete len:508 (-) Transcript_22424:219-1742(-)